MQGLDEERGFTIAEMLVGAAVALTVMGVVAATVDQQGRSASFQHGLADAQLTSRGVTEMLSQDLRMAGFGMLGVPSSAGVQPLTWNVTTASGSTITTLTLRGAYSNVTTELRTAANAGAASVVVDTPTSGSFVVGNQLLIDSGMAAEVATITSVASGGGGVTIGVTPALANAYPPGPSVTQIETVVYQMTGTALRRNGAMVGDNMTNLSLYYIDQDGNVTSTPGANLRSVTLNLTAMEPSPIAGQTHAQSALATEASMRNLAFRFRLS